MRVVVISGLSMLQRINDIRVATSGTKEPMPFLHKAEVQDGQNRLQIHDGPRNRAFALPAYSFLRRQVERDVVAGRALEALADAQIPLPGGQRGVAERQLDLVELGTALWASLA